VFGYKFGSNDGWIVTPAECRVISQAIASYVAGERELSRAWLDELAQWGSYAAWCAERGGFKVW
jgi:hypothetical protein